MRPTAVLKSTRSRKEPNVTENPSPSQPYEPPHIERVLTAEDLEREVQYAGKNSFQN
jgi:hypothetical protein